MTALGAMIRREIAPESVAAHARSLAPLVDELWVVEDVPYGGGISQLTEVLAATDDVVVGHGIAPAPFRNPMALAMEWATLARMYPGRVACGIGHGVQSWMSRIGEQVESPLTLLDETVRTTIALLAGTTPDIDGRYVQLHGYRLEFPPADSPRVSLGVVGPKSLELSGRIGEGTILGEGFGPDEIVAARAAIDRGRADAGRDDDHRLTVFAAFHCGDPEEKPPTPEGAIDGWQAVAPTPEGVVAQLHEIIDVGVDSLVVVPLGHPESQLELILPPLAESMESVGPDPEA